MTRGRRPRRWCGFAALAGPDGSLVWGSFRPTEEAARRYFQSQNPLCKTVIVPVEVRLIEQPAPPFREYDEDV